MVLQIKPHNLESGQTLIETIIAIFMLVVAMLGTLAAMQYFLQAADITTKQVVASGLAAEGVEIIKNTRDNNWLEETIVPNCTELQAVAGPAQPCYDKWLKGNDGGQEKLQVGFDYMPYYDVANEVWVLDRTGGGGDYSLKYAYSFSDGAYVYQNSNASCAGMNCKESLYSRKVTLTDASISSMPASMTAKHPIVKITSVVWWKGKNCPATDNPFTLRASCRVMLVDYITNWKNY
jgi:hypothetical protein